MEEIRLQDLFDMDFLQSFQDNFAKSLGIAAITVDLSGNPVTEPSGFTDFCME